MYSSQISIDLACADPDGQGVWTPVKKQVSIGFLINTGTDPPPHPEGGPYDPLGNTTNIKPYQDSLTERSGSVHG